MEEWKWHQKNFKTRPRNKIYQSSRHRRQQERSKNSHKHFEQHQKLRHNEVESQPITKISGHKSNKNLNSLNIPTEEGKSF